MRLIAQTLPAHYAAVVDVGALDLDSRRIRRALRKIHSESVVVIGGDGAYLAIPDRGEPWSGIAKREAIALLDSEANAS